MIGWTDLPADLSDQAALARIAARLPQAPVISSDLVRAVTTADAVQGTRPRLPHDPALREMYFGAWEGRTHAEIEAEDAAHARALWENPGEIAPPGGESWNAFSARVCAAADRLIGAQGPGPLILVAHFGVILAQLQRARGIKARAAMAQPIDNLSITRLRRTPTGWQVLEVNRLP
jgi:broad specificity phosphatase PhoE